MKKTVLFVAAAMAFSAVQASAMTAVEDMDANGFYSMEEMAASYPDLTAEIFAEIDADASGEISEEELVAAVDTGLLAE